MTARIGHVRRTCASRRRPGRRSRGRRAARRPPCPHRAGRLPRASRGASRPPGSAGCRRRRAAASDAGPSLLVPAGHQGLRRPRHEPAAHERLVEPEPQLPDVVRAADHQVAAARQVVADPDAVAVERAIARSARLDVRRPAKMRRSRRRPNGTTAPNAPGSHRSGRTSASASPSAYGRSTAPPPSSICRSGLTSAPYVPPLVLQDAVLDRVEIPVGHADAVARDAFLLHAEAPGDGPRPWRWSAAAWSSIRCSPSSSNAMSKNRSHARVMIPRPSCGLASQYPISPLFDSVSM